MQGGIYTSRQLITLHVGQRTGCCCALRSVAMVLVPALTSDDRCVQKSSRTDVMTLCYVIVTLFDLWFTFSGEPKVDGGTGSFTHHPPPPN